MPTLTKAELVQKIYNSHPSFTKTQAGEIVENFLVLAKEALIEGNGLLLSGFGKFNVKKKNPRRGRNPQTGSSLILDARQVVTFKPSGILREMVNKDE